VNANTAQAQEALRLANKIRLERVELRRHLKTLTRLEGYSLVAQLVEDDPPYLSNLAVYKLLTYCYSTGSYAAALMLRKAGLSERVTVGTLTDRQRRALREVLAPELVPA
jgi:hypothetical protein